MSWVPTTDFEEEVVSSQTDHNFVFGYLGEQPQEVFYPRPKEHLAFAAKKQQEPKENISSKLNVIANIQRIARTKPLGEQPTLKDWDNNDNVEQETIAMIRHCGFGPSIEQAFNEKCTIATLPITEKMRINQNGRKRLPVFFDEKFFELRPRASTSGSSELESTSTGTCHSADNSSTFSESSKTSSNEVIADEKSSSASDATSPSISTFDTAIEITAFSEPLDVGLSEEESYSTALSDQFIPTQSWRSSDYRQHCKNSTDRRNSDNSNAVSASSTSNSVPTAKPISKRKLRPNQKERRFQTARDVYAARQRCNEEENRKRSTVAG